MPQIWLTYDELGAFLGVAAGEARDKAIAMQRPRRRCSDGATRVKLTDAQMAGYFAQYSQQFIEMQLVADNGISLELQEAVADLTTAALRTVQALAGRPAEPAHQIPRPNLKLLVSRAV